MEVALALVGGLAGLGGGILGWRYLARGSYRYAGDPPPRRSRWVVPVSGFASAAVVFGLREWPWVVGLTGVLAAVTGVTLAAIDLEVHRLPRVVTWPAYPVLAVLLTAASAVTGDWLALRRAAAVAVATWAVYYLLHLAARRRGFGRGDVTLAGLVGMLLGWFGWPAVLVATYLTFVLAGVWAAALLVTRRATRSTRIAFGPFMIAATLVLLAAQ